MQSIEDQIAQHIGEAVKKATDAYLTGYNSPLNPIINAALSRQSAAIASTLDAALDSLTKSDEFKAQLIEALNAKLARTIISKMDGELEKRMNDLRANPATRARITLAIENIVKESINAY